VPVASSVLKVIELHSEMVEPVSFSEPVCAIPMMTNSWRQPLLLMPVTS
jgi:hypothetical protein